MTEAKARAALRALDGLGALERWMVEQRPWQAAPGGWTVAGELQGWRFRLEVVPGGVRVGTVQRLGVYAASAHGRPEPGDGSNSWPKPEPSAPL